MHAAYGVNPASTRACSSGALVSELPEGLTGGARSPAGLVLLLHGVVQHVEGFRVVLQEADEVHGGAEPFDRRRGELAAFLGRSAPLLDGRDEPALYRIARPRR